MGHVLRLTEHLLYNIDPALQATFVACIIIGWLLLTNVPRVHEIRQSASSKNQFWNWHGYFSRAEAYSARLTIGSPSRLVLLQPQFNMQTRANSIESKNNILHVNRA